MLMPSYSTAIAPLIDSAWLGLALGSFPDSALLPKSVLQASVFATVLIGFIGIILKRNLMMKILAMDVMSTGVIAFYVLVAAHNGLFTPIITGEENVAYADPVPQAVILTAIVIGFSIQALMLVGVMKLARNNPTLEIDEIEQSHTP